MKNCRSIRVPARSFASFALRLFQASLLIGAAPAMSNRYEARAQVIDKRATLSKYSWLDNRDYDWFAARIPFF